MKESKILKLCLFATGLSGIVSEYVLSTLASYFLGNTVFQWTMTVSIMLFAMGLGSRISKFFTKNLLEKFIYIEFILSILSALSAIFVYSLSSQTSDLGFFIYLLSISIGLLIGLEIPLVVRLNENFEELRLNIAAVMEKDYYGSLLGGVFFAFVGLPILGLTYTPFILGAINFIVAIVLVLKVSRKRIKSPKRIYTAALLTLTIITSSLIYAEDIVLFGEQARYKDKIIYSKQTKYQKIVITEWKNDHWLFINGNQQLSSFDEFMYHEPLVHIPMALLKERKDILILGGGDGCAARELLKYKDIKKITVVDLDPEMTRLANENEILLSLNHGALKNSKVKIVNQDAFNYLNQTKEYFDLIIIDLPDPKTIDLARLYSKEFYSLCNRQLRQNGMMITQAGSPYYATKAFLSINKTIQATGFNTLKLHNHIVTMGEWGFILAAKSEQQLKEQLIQKDFNNLNLRWLNKDALQLMTSFGKNLLSVDSNKILVNRFDNLILSKYYNEGNWDLY